MNASRHLSLAFVPQRHVRLDAFVVDHPGQELGRTWIASGNSMTYIEPRWPAVIAIARRQRGADEALHGQIHAL